MLTVEVYDKHSYIRVINYIDSIFHCYMKIIQLMTISQKYCVVVLQVTMTKLGHPSKCFILYLEILTYQYEIF